MENKGVYEIVRKNGKQDNEGCHALPEAPKGFGVRHTQALLLFLCITVGYALRANLSVSMVAMTTPTFEHHVPLNSTELYNSQDFVTTTEGAGGIDHNSNYRTPNGTLKRDFEREQPDGWSVYRTYKWHKSTQEMIVFSFFVGYTTMQLPMGYLAHRYGGKLPIMAALLVNGVLSLLTPWLPVFGGWLALCGGRLIQGMAQGAFFPSTHTLLAKWAPLSERSRLGTYVYCGQHFGTILVFPISGYFAGSSLGWPATFWCTGVGSLACLLLVWGLGASSPHDHPRIAAEELAFIMEGGSADVVPKKRRTPWKHILGSRAVWAQVSAHVGSAAASILLLTQSPTYMNYVLGVEIKKNGLLSSLPYVAMVVTVLCCGWLADCLANRNILTVVNIRRIACTVGMAVSGCFLVGFSYAQSTTLAVALLILTLASHSTVHVGHHINQIDLAPNFAGNIMAFGNMLANLTSLLVPVIVSNVVRDDLKNQQKWQTVFLLFAGLLCITNLVFVVFCRGTVQPWNFYGEEGHDVEAESPKTREDDSK